MRTGEIPDATATAPAVGSVAMTGDADVHRVVIELRRGEGPMSGRLLAEGGAQPQPFCGWLEFLALLETVRPPTDPAPRPEEKP